MCVLKKKPQGWGTTAGSPIPVGDPAVSALRFVNADNEVLILLCEGFKNQ